MRIHTLLELSGLGTATNNVSPAPSPSSSLFFPRSMHIANPQKLSAFTSNALNSHGLRRCPAPSSTGSAISNPASSCRSPSFQTRSLLSLPWLARKNALCQPFYIQSNGSDFYNMVNFDHSISYLLHKTLRTLNYAAICKKTLKTRRGKNTLKSSFPTQRHSSQPLHVPSKPPPGVSYRRSKRQPTHLHLP